MTSFSTLREYARNKKAYPTDAEKKFAEACRNLNVRFRSQVIIGNYIVDFLIRNVIVEIDGSYHFTENQIIKDKIREEVLKDTGYVLIRFTNEQVFSDAENCILFVRKFYRENRKKSNNFLNKEDESFDVEFIRNLVIRKKWSCPQHAFKYLKKCVRKAFPEAENVTQKGNVSWKHRKIFIPLED